MPIQESTKERDLHSKVHRSEVVLENIETHQVANTIVQPGDETWKGRQITTSQGHRRNPKTGKYDSGGPFYTARFEVRPGVAYRSLWKEFSLNPAFAYRYNGNIMTPVSSIGTTDADFEGFRSKDTSDLDPIGASAISACAPTNSVAALSSALAEGYREGLPSLPGIQTWRRRTELFRSLGSEYLNHVFGWVPFLGEITTVRDAARKHRDVLSQYHRDEGKSVRREFNFDTDSNVEEFSEPGRAVFPGASMGFFNSTTPGTLTTRVSTTRRRWFSGAFTYALPSQGDTWRKALGYGSDADKLYGIAITPDTLWELTPWSWAVDWFSNAGDVINNVTQFSVNGLVMRYGYMMEETSEIVTTSLDRSGLLDHGVEVPPPPPSVVKRVTKVRREANPFGFGLGWEGLSPTQLAITAALGITRL